MQECNSVKSTCNPTCQQTDRGNKKIATTQTHHTEQSPVFANVCSHLAWSAVAASSRAHEGGALASEAWLHLITCFFCGPPTGEASAPDGVEQAAPPGVVHIDVAVAWRSEEAAFKDF